MTQSTYNKGNTPDGHATGGKRVAWLEAILYAWKMAFHFDRSQLVIVRSLLSTFGFILPLAIGVASGHVIEGVSIAAGASSLGGVSLNATHRARIRTMLLASLGVAVSACVGALTGPYPWLSIILIGLWSSLTGLLVVIGQRAVIIGLQSTLALIVLTHFNLSPMQALLEALLLLIGALFQVLLSVIPFWQSIGSDRSMLANSYQALADYATDTNRIDHIRQVRVALKQAEDALEYSRSSRNKMRRSIQLLQQATNIRLALTLLTEIFHIMLDYDHDRYAPIVEQMQRQIEHILRAIAQHIKSPQTTIDLSHNYQTLDALIQDIIETGASNYKFRAIKRYYKMLRSYLRSAEKLTTSHRSTSSITWRIRLPGHPDLHFRDPLKTFKANLSLNSTAFRHAIRLAIVMVIAASIYRFAPIERSYWIPIAALFVLQPDFTSTVTRGIARMVGTTCGALSIALLLHFIAPTYATLIIIEMIVTFCAYALLFANYSLFSFFITIQIIILLSFIDRHTFQIGLFRVIDTIIGGGLALVVYMLWPTWEHLRVAENISRRLDTLQRYYLAVMKVYITPDKYNVGSIEQYRKAARLDRTNADASVERALNEPELHPFDKNTMQCLLVESDHIAKTIISLEAYLLAMPDRSPLPMVTALSQSIARALRIFAHAIRTEQPAPSIQDIQQQIQEIEEEKKKLYHADSTTFTTLSFLLHTTRHIVSNLQTMDQLLSARHERRKENAKAGRSGAAS